MGQLGSSSVFQYAEFGVESSWSLGLKLSAAAAARSDFIWILFFCPSAGALEIIYNRCFTFLNLILIYWTCLAEIIEQFWACLSAPALLGDLTSHLWKQLNPCNILKEGFQGFYW